MLGSHGRSLPQKVFSAPVRALAAAGVRPNHITIAGTLITVVVAMTLLGRGHWAAGALTLAVVLFADSIDGLLARYTQASSQFGAFLDSTLDRVGDGAVFASLVYWIAVGMNPGWERTWMLIAALVTLVGATTVPYARAKAEAMGTTASGGIAERTDRLVIVLVGCGLYGFGLTVWLPLVAFTWTAFATVVTTGVRIARARQGLQEAANPTRKPAKPGPQGGRA